MPIMVSYPNKRQRSMDLSFSDDDLHGIQTPHDDPLVISAIVCDFQVYRILVTIGSSSDILSFDAFKKLGLDPALIENIDAPLTDFTNHSILPEGLIKLPVTFGSPPCQVTSMVSFHVVNVPSAYNIILGRPSLHDIRAVVSTYHMCMKFPTEGGIGRVKGDQGAARSCYYASTRLRESPSPPDIKYS